MMRCAIVSIRAILCAVMGAALGAGCVTEEKETSNYAFSGSEEATEGKTIGSQIDAYKKRVEAMPERIDLRAKLAKLYFGDQQYDEAFATIREAIAKDPGNAELYNIQGEFYLHMNKLPEAEESYRQLVKNVRPGFTGPSIALGYVLALREKYGDAIAEFERVLALSPRQPTALYYLGCCYDITGNRDAALKCFKECATMETPYQKKARSEIFRIENLNHAQPLSQAGGAIEIDGGPSRAALTGLAESAAPPDPDDRPRSRGGE